MRFLRKTNGPCPSQGPTSNAPVGLLTSELKDTHLLIVWIYPNDNGNKTWCPRSVLGYSGGAVPDSHRSSLFVDRETTTIDHQRTNYGKLHYQSGNGLSSDLNHGF